VAVVAMTQNTWLSTYKNKQILVSAIMKGKTLAGGSKSFSMSYPNRKL
jgi:hypothetical protein